MLEKPEKVFPCDCMGEGLVVTTTFEADDGFGNKAAIGVSRDGKDEEKGYYMVNISFWSVAPYYDGRLTWRGRLRWAWDVLRKGNPWPDMVALTPAVAKNFANNILYKVEQIQKKIVMKKDEL